MPIALPDDLIDPAPGATLPPDLIDPRPLEAAPDDLVDPTEIDWGKSLENLPGNLRDIIMSTAKLGTPQGIAEVGIRQVMHPGEDLSALVDRYSKYLSPEGRKELLEEDPAGVGLDVLSLLGGAVGLASKARGARAAGGSAKVEEAAGAAKALPDDLIEANVTTTGERAGNINLDKIFAPEDAKQLLKDVAAGNKDFTDATRGVRSWKDTQDAADLLGMTPEKLLQRRKGEAFNAEEVQAARQVFVDQEVRVREAARAADGGGDAEVAKLMEEATRLVAVQEQVAGLTAEAGRALNIFKNMVGANKEQMASFAEMARAGRVEDIIDLVKRSDNAPPGALTRALPKVWKAKTTEKAYEAWINWGLLSGPQTHATNILSNSLVALYSVPENLLTAGISKMTGSGIHMGETLGRTIGLFEGMKEGLWAGTRTFMSEQPSRLGAAKLADVRHQAIGGATGKAVRIPGRALMAEDEFFKSIAKRQEINALAYRTAKNEGLTGETLGKRMDDLRRNPTEEMINASNKAADERTFTKPLGPAGRNLMALIRNVPGLRVIAPFIRTPANIFKFGIERSPFAPLMKEVRANLTGKNGARARDEAIAKIALGSTVSTVAGYMAMQGLLTGGGPQDPKERALLYRNGWQPYSLKIGDNYYSYGRLEPMGMLLGIAGDFVELSGKMTETEADKIGSLIVGAVAKNVLNKTFLRGISDAIEASNDPERYGQQFVQNLVGTTVPTFVAQIARTRDPHLREVRSMLDKIKERIPGQRETLLTRKDIFGEPITLEGSLGPDILSPIYQSTDKKDPVVNELLRLDLPISRPQRQIENADLTPEEYDAYQVEVGQRLRTLLDGFIKAPGWGKLSDDQKRDAISKYSGTMRDQARAAVVAKFPDLRMRILALKNPEAVQAAPQP